MHFMKYCLFLDRSWTHLLCGIIHEKLFFMFILNRRDINAQIFKNTFELKVKRAFERVDPTQEPDVLC